MILLKTIRYAFIFLILHTTPSFAQELTARTNEFTLDLAMGVPQNSEPLPVIRWTHPQMEFTTVNPNKLNIKARILNRSPLNEVKVIAGNASDKWSVNVKTIPIKYEQRIHDLSNGHCT